MAVFDTLALAGKLEAAGFPSKQAQDTAAALAETFGSEIVTKDYLRAELRDLEQRIMIKLGSMMAASIAVVAVLVRLL